MDDIGMQGESGYRAPNLTVKYPVSIGTAALEPTLVGHPNNRDGKEYQNG
jgi:hypothetical protein